MTDQPSEISRLPDRLSDINLLHEVFPGTGFGELIDELMSDRFDVLRFHADLG